MRGWMWLAAGTLALDGCCTEAGCAGGVSVHITGNAPDVYTVEVVHGDLRARCDVDALAATVTCDDPLAEGSFGNGTAEVTFLINDDPETIHVMLSDAGGNVLVDDDVAPLYGDPFYPNGKRCGPACVGGEVDVDVP